MPYPLVGLLKIRAFRVDAAEKALCAAETRLRAAEEARAAREAEREDYRIWRQAEVERRYQAIMGQTLGREEIDAFKAGLSALADEELAREAAWLDAGRAAEEARQTAQTVRADWLLANKANEKLRYHRDNWQKTQDMKANRQEDLEQEEFKPLLFEAGSEEQ
jgi:type III secretion protein O